MPNNIQARTDDMAPAKKKLSQSFDVNYSIRSFRYHRGTCRFCLSRFF